MIKWKVTKYRNRIFLAVATNLKKPPVCVKCVFVSEAAGDDK